MASVYKEILIEASPEKVWGAVRAVGRVHECLAPGFVTSTRLENGTRVVTFANGLVVRELIVTIDDQNCRLAYASVKGRPTYHHASMQVFAESESRSKLVWLTDVLPDEMARPIGELMEEGSLIIKETLEA
ncbi:MAG TPA: SRPBCC family protein [Chloroflexia bacterium]|nr:SRPBCC family protein [Chloroflexia bacterium]